MKADFSGCEEFSTEIIEVKIGLLLSVIKKKQQKKLLFNFYYAINNVYIVS